MQRLALNSRAVLRHASTLQFGRNALKFPAQMTQIPAVLPTSHRRQQEGGVGIIQQRSFHVTTKDESAVVIGGLALAATAILGQYAVRAWGARQAAKQQEEPENGAAAERSAEGNAQEGDSGSAATSFTSSWFARTFYDGGFEEKMSRREAALILGVRETANAQRIKEAHRRILLINHPDTGGSTYLATKINEAKDLLLKGKQ